MGFKYCVFGAFACPMPEPQNANEYFLLIMQQKLKMNLNSLTLCNGLLLLDRCICRRHSVRYARSSSVRMNT